MSDLVFGKGDVPGMIREHLQTGQTAVDVGAALGEMTAIMADCVGPTGRVYAIEADPLKEALLRGRVHTCPSRVSVCITGVGEATGSMPLHRVGTTAASRWHGKGHTQTFTVPMITLDALVPTGADLVKMDVQGSEGHVLDGATRLLRECPVWILELWPWGLATAKRPVQRVLEALRDHGMTVYWPKGPAITDESLERFLKDAGGMSNILATRKPEFHRNVLAVRC